MTTLYAEQLIYTRVESAYSPRRSAGYQTVYRGPSVSSATVEEIEKHIQCFRPKESELTRLQYFRLGNGAAVLTSSRQIDTHAEIVDRDRRRGIFMAHCLIVSRNEFAKADYNPWPLLDQFPFLHDAERMVDQFGKATGEAPTVAIEVDLPHRPILSSWPGQEAVKIVSLALEADQLKQDGKSVLMIGSPQEINETLKIVFYLLPIRDRPDCSFDTSIESCTIRPGTYWAVGASSRQSSSSYYVVNASESKVISSLPILTARDDLYLEWLQHVSLTSDFPSRAGKAHAVQQLARAFANRQHLSPEHLDRSACSEFLHLNEERVIRDLGGVLAEQLGRSLAKPLSLYMNQVIPPATFLSIAASGKISPAYLCEIVAHWIVETEPDLRGSEWKTIQDMARKGGDMRLLHWAATGGRRVTSRIRDEALKSMAVDTFQAALERLGPIPPANFVTPRHLLLLLTDRRLTSMTDEQFLDLVSAIIEAGLANQLAPLTKYIDRLDNTHLTQLEKIIKKHKLEIPEHFNSQVLARREQVGDPPGFLERIF